MRSNWSRGGFETTVRRETIAIETAARVQCKTGRVATVKHSLYEYRDAVVNARKGARDQSVESSVTGNPHSAPKVHLGTDMLKSLAECFAAL